MKKSDFMREVADAMDKGDAQWWRNFEWSPDSYLDHERRWFVCDNSIQPMTAAIDGRIRRRPRTIKVSGDIPEYISKLARRVFEDPRGRAESYHLARALLDLIEHSGGE